MKEFLIYSKEMDQSNCPFMLRERCSRLKLRLSIVKSLKYQMQLTCQALMTYHSLLMKTLDRPPLDIASNGSICEAYKAYDSAEAKVRRRLLLSRFCATATAFKETIAKTETIINDVLQDCGELDDACLSQAELEEANQVKMFVVNMKNSLTYIINEI